MNSKTLPAIAAAVACALLTAPAALAATTTTPSGENTPLNLDTAPAAEHTSTGGGGIVRTIVGLAVVIGVILGLHWILKQVKSSRESTSSGTGLQSIATLALGPGRSLHLVRAGSEIVLVGAADGSVTPLRVYSEAEARSLGLLDLAAGSGDDPDAPGGSGWKGGGANPLNAGRGLAAGTMLKRIQKMTVRG
jgi:flagellar protein FliO/FliZ